jgi:hypothetical protein
LSTAARALSLSERSVALLRNISGGGYTHQFCVVCDGPPKTLPTYYTLWTNAELAGEHWSQGFAFRFFLGSAFGASVSRVPNGTASTYIIPYVGIGLGFAF